MGLTFSYELRLPASSAADDVNDVLRTLKRHTYQLGFVAVSETVARVAGRFHDAIGEVAPVQSPIFEYPDFERLEG